MFALASLGFLTPVLLLGLLALPLLWWLLRAIPPAAIQRRFPAVTLLLGLKDPESTPAKTPWWLLALRMLALAAMIVGFAGPILNPKAARLATGPLLILSDASWASAPDWSTRQDKIAELLREAARRGRPAAVVLLSDKPPEATRLPLRDARDWGESVKALVPAPWEPDYAAFNAWLKPLSDQKYQTVWLSDGLARKGRAALAKALAARGRLTVLQSNASILALAPPKFENGKISIDALRSQPGPARIVTINAYGPDPAGINRRLATSPVTFEEGAPRTSALFDLPSELRNRIRQFKVASQRSAGAVALTDDALKRRKVALFAGQRPREGQELVTALHFLKKALEPTADLIEAPVLDSLRASPDVVILADVAKMTKPEASALEKWVRAGGLLVRFAGPKLAAASARQLNQDPLLPVRLRAGGRNVGGAMSWGSPKLLKPFNKSSPFFGLKIPADVSVTSQVLAQPDPSLAARTIASLQDGTPLVTRKSLGDGQVVLFHVTANAEWSSLPLSGLFVQMLGRLAVSTRATAPTKGDLAGQLWQPQQVMDGFGALRAADNLVAVPGERLAKGVTAADLLPGTYGNGARQIAVNVITPKRALAPATWPQSVEVSGMVDDQQQPLKALFLAASLLLLMLDIVASLWLGGRLRGPRANTITPMLLIGGFALLMATLAPPRAYATTDEEGVRATRETVLAYVKTGDKTLDATSRAGLFGLSQVLAQRTAIEPGDPIAVNIETDELAFFPLIYWPISESQPLPSATAYRRLNAYLRFGGMILFDTRDANLGGFGNGTPNGRRLQQIASQLDIPALEPIPADHVLTRSFYLLQDFPGRYAQTDVWVEAAPKDAVRAEGMPFRNLNDGVSPVVIGGNDWAAAWAILPNGDYMFPVGRGGYGGARQRELAYRFGINLVMYVLTGNYKSDQVHVPALLERLGQ